MSYLKTASRAEIDKCHKEMDDMLDGIIDEFRKREQMMRAMPKIRQAFNEIVGANGNGTGTQA